MTQEFLLQNSWLIALAVGSGAMLVLPYFLKRGGKECTVAEATAMLNHRKAVLIDIRDDETVRTHGTVTLAKRVLLSDVEAKVPTLVKNKEIPVVVMCNMGQKSQSAAAKLRGLGYTDVFSLQGGFTAWQAAGMPIKKTQAA